jgi:electron transfer flavoprotein alpha subunit
MKTLVIAEHNNTVVNSSTLKTITAAKEIGSDITILVAGYQCGAVAEACAKIANVNKVLLVDELGYQHHTAENLSQLVADIGKDFTHILAPADTFGKNFMPRVAALLDVAQVSDVIKVLAPDTFMRPIYAGNAIATVQAHDPIKVITVRTSSFAAIAGEGHADMEALDHPIETGLSEFVSQNLNVSGRPDLGAARVVIAGGRGLQNGENFKLLESLADAWGAGLGASRAAVDAGYVPNDYQVGQTGKIVAPELYIAVGISGAIQHLAGMKDSKVIVAINKDPDAPIFQIADYGLVGDLFEIIPELDAELVKVLQK